MLEVQRKRTITHLDEVTSGLVGGLQGLAALELAHRRGQP